MSRETLKPGFHKLCSTRESINKSKSKTFSSIGNEPLTQSYKEYAEKKDLLVPYPGGGGVLSFMGHIGMCRCEGLVFKQITLA